MYSVDCVRRHDPSYIWVEHLCQEWKIGENIAFAINRIFSSSLYWPIDPYKTILHILRRKERHEDLVFGTPVGAIRPSDALDLKGHIIRSTTFMPLNLAGQPYMALLISSASARRAQDLLSEFNGLIGNIPAIVSSNGINARYVEAIHVNSCMTGTVRCYRAHVHEVMVEATLSGDDMDACLLLYIRRILEEGSCAEATQKLLAPRIFVSMREADIRNNRSSDQQKAPFSFLPSEIKTAKRQMILSSMKASVVDGGSIWLQCYFYTGHTVPTLRSSTQHLSQRTFGYVLHRRRYSFTFKHLRTGFVKCFYRNPYENLALCLFQSPGEEQLVRQNFSSHCERVGTPSSLMQSCVLDFVRSRCTLFLKYLDAGELALAMECALMIVAHSATDPHNLPIVGTRLSSISAGASGYLRLVRDGVDNVATVLKYLQCEIKSISLQSLRQDRRLWSDAQSTHVQRLEHQLMTLPSAIEEIRYLLSNIWRDIYSSERNYIQPYVASRFCLIQNISQRRIHLLAAALHSEAKFQKDLRASEFIGNPTLVTININWLNAISIPLHHISIALHMFEATLASDTLMELLQLDADPKMELFRNITPKISLPLKDAPMTKSPIGLYYFTDRKPSTVTEFLGLLTQIVDRKDLIGIEEWRPFDSESFAYKQFIKHRSGTVDELPPIGSSHSHIRFRPNEEPHNESAETYVLDTDAEELAFSMDSQLVKKAFSKTALSGTFIFTSPEEQKEIPGRFISRFLRVYSSLGVGWRGRLGAVDAIAAILEESYKYDSPRGIAEEAARSRYLIGARVLSALNEGVKNIVFSPDRSSPYLALCGPIYKFSTRQHLWRYSNEDILKRFPLYVSSLRHGSSGLSGNIEYPNLSGPHRHGYFKLALESSKSRKAHQSMSMKDHTSVYLRGGIFGPLELLKGLSCWRQVYLSAWLLPPIMTKGSFQVKANGVVLETYCGVSGETALSWSTPRMSLTEVKSRDRVHAHTDKAPACFGDSDVWSAEPDGKIYIDVVVKVTKDREQSADVARDLFADEVISIVDELSKHGRWISFEMSVQSCEDKMGGNQGAVRTPQPEKLTVYPQAKVLGTTPVEFGSTTRWATRAVMTALRVWGEATVECAVLLGQQVDDGKYARPGLAQENTARSSNDVMSVDESTAIARQIEADSPGESCPAMFPALIENFKDICGLAKESRKASAKPGVKPSGSSLLDDKWWGGGEGWRGTEGDAAHDMDPTAREVHRNNIFSSSAQRVQKSVALREESPRVYVPCQIRFSLLCFSVAESFSESLTSEEELKENDEASVGSIPKLSKIRSIFKKAAMKAKLVNSLGDTPQGLVIGGGRVISRLLGSTVWFSSDAAMAVWSCLPLNESVSLDKHTKLVKAVISAESKAKLIEAHDFVMQEPPDHLRAFRHAGVSELLSPNADSLKQIFPDAIRMNESLAYRARCISDTLKMLRLLLHRPVCGPGNCIGLANLDGLSTTLVLHMSLSVRLLVTSPQCVHFAGGLYIILTLVHRMETLLQLGKFSLMEGMRSGYSVLQGGGNSPWKLPVPSLDNDTLAEMREKRVLVDGTIGVRRAIAAGGDALAELTDIILNLEGACTLLAGALAQDVYDCSMHSLSAHINNALDKFDASSANFNILAKRMDKRTAQIAAKKVTFVDPQLEQDKVDMEGPVVEDGKDEGSTDHEFNIETAAFLNAIEESLMLPAEREQTQKAAIASTDESSPSVLHGRIRRPKIDRSYGPDDVTMLDELREIAAVYQGR